MLYELKQIELLRSTDKIKDELDFFKSEISHEKIIQDNNFTTLDFGLDKNEIKSKCEGLIQKHKSIYKEEQLRITHSLKDHKIEDDPIVFNKYLDINYKGLIELKNNTPSNVPDFDLMNEDDFYSNYSKFIIHKINSCFFNKFLNPLLLFIEAEFKYELIANGLIDSPQDDFINAIANNKVMVDIKSKNEPDEYNQIHSQTSDMFFNLHYNNYVIESSYNEYLLNIFKSFKSYINDNLKGNDSIAKKLDFLNDLFINISEINDLFYTNDSDLRIIPQKMKYHRNDAISKLRMELFDIKISSDFNDFIGNLSSLVSIQHNYSNLSLKFIQNKTNLLKNQDEVVTNTISQKVLGKPTKESKKKTESKLQWRGQINILIRIFYELHHDVIIDGKPILNASKNQIVDLLFENFINKDGDELSKDTILTGLNPSRHDKRAPDHKKYKLPPLE